MSLIDYADLFGLVVTEYEEFVIQQVHLHYSLLNAHRLDGEGLFADNELGLLLNVLACLEDTLRKRA